MEKNWNQYFFNFILRNMDKPWNWDGLSENPSITCEIVEANPDKPWDWFWLSSNPSITFAIVEANPNEPWDWETLSENKFTKAKEEFEKRVSHQNFIQENILEELVKAYMHPKRIVMLLDMGYQIEELDDIMEK